MKKIFYSLTSGSFRRKLLLLTGFLWLGVMSSLFAQKTYVYSGTVTDAQGETLPGVNVLVKGTTTGAATDINGAFSFTNSKPSLTLVISFVGSVTKQVEALGGVPVKVSLESSTVGLSELVVVGYGVQKKSVVTGAISSVKGSDLNNMQIPRIEQALQGRTSGLTIASSSGQPGASSTVRVRGTTSINNSDPLYVVDGVPVDVGGIDYLNSADVESIEVLKDAASAAIYGTRAASGVILVTTKKGKSGNIQVNYNAYFGTQAPAKKLSLLNAKEYATLQNESATNADPNAILPFPDVATLGAGTDWQSTIFNNKAGIQNHELSVSGGNDKITFYSSFGYLDQQGIVASEISNYKRLNLRFNSTYKVNSWLHIGSNLGYSHIKSKGSLNVNSEFGGPLSSAINLDPTTPEIITDPAVLATSPYVDKPVVKDANGNPYGISTRVVQELTNPLAYIQTQLGNFGWSDNLVGNVYAEVEPVKGLKLKSDLGAKLAFWGNESFTPIYYLNAASESKSNSFTRGMNSGMTWNWENTASYTKTINQHNFTALVGVSAFVDNSYGVSAKYSNLPYNTFAEASMNTGIIDADRLGYGYEGTDHKISSMFARLNYNYKEKYLLTGIVRRDGSSRFGSNNKYGTFPSLSLGWVASREDFWPKNNVVASLKVRGSYGVNGNDNIGDSRYVSTVGSGRNYTLGQDNYVIGYSPNAPANPDLKWEQTSQSNLGLEATLFQDFTLVFDLYSKKTTGMLWDVVLPAYVGAAGNPIGNVASMTNKGVELELGYRKQLGDVSINLSGNASYLKNEVTDLGTIQFRTGASFQSSTYEISRLAVGQPVGAFYGFETLGLFKKQSDVLNYTDPKTGVMIQPNAQPGDFKFADLNGDGKITGDDRTFIGDPTPTWSFGFNISADYKGFDIQIFGQGVAGNQIFNGLRRLDIAGANWTTAALDRWTPTNPLASFPRLINGDPNKNFTTPSTFYLSDGSYLRIKTLQIGYTLPKNLLSKVGLQKIRFYLSSNNLYTFTKYTGYDPEIGGSSYGIDRGIYPQARSFLAGVNVSF